MQLVAQPNMLALMGNADPQGPPGYEKQPRFESIIRLGPPVRLGLPERIGLTVRLDDGRVEIHELGSLPPKLLFQELS